MTEEDEKRKKLNEALQKKVGSVDNAITADFDNLDLSSSKVVNSGAADKVAETASVTGGPSLATVQKATPADAIKEATDKKALSSNIAMAKEGAKILGVGPDSGDTSVEGGAASGALSGAAMGAKIGGPYGAIIGGAIGGISGGLQASSAQKAAYEAAKQKAKAEHLNKMVTIEEDKDRKIQNALEGMKSAFSKNFQNNKSVKL